MSTLGELCGLSSHFPHCPPGEPSPQYPAKYPRITPRSGSGMAADLATPNGPRSPLRPREHEGTDHREPGARVAAVDGAMDCAHPEAPRHVPKLPVLATFENTWPGRPRTCRCTPRSRSRTPGLRVPLEQPPLSNLLHSTDRISHLHFAPSVIHPCSVHSR
jgi:hypothetical protein